jgi:hypothetical protein
LEDLDIDRSIELILKRKDVGWNSCSSGQGPAKGPSDQVINLWIALNVENFVLTSLLLKELLIYHH